MTSRAVGPGAHAAEPAAGARDAFGRREWTDAYAGLAAADLESPLDPADVERLAIAAHLTGRSDAADLWERAHRELLAAGDIPRAARCLFWLGMGLTDLGEHARGGAWLARGQRLLDEGGDECTDCVERGYLMVPAALQLLFTGDGPGALAAFSAISDVAVRFGDPDLIALSRLGLGQVTIRSGRLADGVALLDEAMVAVTAGETSSIVAGIVYCAVISSCQLFYDVRRAQEWTAALTRWCDSQPGLVPYRGQCMVHRAQILQVHGAWAEAVDSARLAIDRFAATPADPAVGMAFHELGELSRLRGEFDLAEEAYREASRRGHDPQPGRALLRLAQGQPDAAAAALRRALDEPRDPLERPRLLAAFVESALAADDVAAARAAADELAAASVDVPWLRAVATCARGAVLLAGGDPQDALVALRPAWSAWQDLEVPYEAARVRVMVGLACRQLGDEDTAQMEFDAARWVFDQLGAAPDLARVTTLMRPSAAVGRSSVLTAREVEVLRVVAAGKTNRAIAADLFLSEKTVARHMSNILAKLGLPSRAAATAWAYEHDLI